MSGKFTTVRLSLDGEKFEILVNPDAALSFKLGRKIDVSQVIAVEEVYSDSSKGLRVSSEKLLKYLGTSVPSEAAEEVLKRGELQLTTDQRRSLIEDKRRQIVSLITRNYVDPRTSMPHPPLRIEQGMQEARVSIDPFRSAEEQAKMVVDQLRSILPLKSERIKLAVKVLPQYAPQSIGILKRFGEVLDESWGPDGSLTVKIQIPAGARAGFMEKLGAVTKGTVQASLER